MSIVFYDCSTAPSPRRARIILAEKNVSHEVVEIDLRRGEQMGEDFRKINPDCTVPALKLDDGLVLTDNAGIAAYLEAAYPETPLLGGTPEEKAQVASWNSKLEMHLGMGVASALRNANPHMKGRALPGKNDYEQIPELAARGLAQIDHALADLESHLEGRDFIVGDSLSVADITAGVFIDFAKVVRKKPSEDMTNIARWRGALAARPSFQK